jgi:hypothetical protein
MKYFFTVLKRHKIIYREVGFHPQTSYDIGLPDAFHHTVGSANSCYRTQIYMAAFILKKIYFLLFTYAKIRNSWVASRIWPKFWIPLAPPSVSVYLRHCMLRLRVPWMERAGAAVFLLVYNSSRAMERASSGVVKCPSSSQVMQVANLRYFHRSFSPRPWWSILLQLPVFAGYSWPC